LAARLGIGLDEVQEAARHKHLISSYLHSSLVLAVKTAGRQGRIWKAPGIPTVGVAKCCCP
jgi:hypothetical protein